MPTILFWLNMLSSVPEFIVWTIPTFFLAEPNHLVSSPTLSKHEFISDGRHRCFSCDQAALRTLLSVRPSVYLYIRLSVCPTFFTMFPSSYHHQIFRSYYHWQKRCPCNRSRSGVKSQCHRGKQGKSEGFDSCDRPSNLTQTGFKSSIFQPVWPWYLMDDPKKQ